MRHRYLPHPHNTISIGNKQLGWVNAASQTNLFTCNCAEMLGYNWFT